MKKNKPPKNYVPGMDEIMDTTHMRHSRFWFGGNANDWELAGYESGKIKEKPTDASGFPLFKKEHANLRHAGPI
ncbi:MAG: hypothetical protein M1369_05515 [Deinococcus sp.]|nr:hypothetical protein [Deinococcus sp.]MCL5965229.1 hypothetical protein [Deinococcus sp.]